MTMSAELENVVTKAVNGDDPIARKYREGQHALLTGAPFKSAEPEVQVTVLERLKRIETLLVAIVKELRT